MMQVIISDATQLNSKVQSCNVLVELFCRPIFPEWWIETDEVKIKGHKATRGCNTLDNLTPNLKTIFIIVTVT